MTEVPHFTITDITGETVDYSRIWQHRQLVLVVLPRSASTDAADYAMRLREALADSSPHTAVVITNDDITGIAAPAVVIADRWGEIIHSVRTERVADLPGADELRDWIEHVRMRCPECEGEWR